MSHELYYTSAPKGLELGTSGFCTVAATRGLPRPLREQMQALSDYRHLFTPLDPRNPVGYAYTQVRAGGGLWFVLSRTADAPLDYTGRGNYFAHHVALEAAELPRGGPAWLASQRGFLETTWRGEPRTLDAGRPALGGDQPPAPCRRWESAAGDAGWAGVLAQQFDLDPGRPVALVYHAGFDPLPLLAEALALLPPQRRWEVTFNTYYTAPAPGVPCAWRCLPRAYLEREQPAWLGGALVLDLTRPLGRAPNGPLAEGARTGRVDLNAPRPAPAPREAPAPAAERTDLYFEPTTPAAAFARSSDGWEAPAAVAAPPRPALAPPTPSPAPPRAPVPVSPAGPERRPVPASQPAPAPRAGALGFLLGGAVGVVLTAAFSFVLYFAGFLGLQQDVRTREEQARAAEQELVETRAARDQEKKRADALEQEQLGQAFESLLLRAALEIQGDELGKGGEGDEKDLAYVTRQRDQFKKRMEEAEKDRDQIRKVLDKNTNLPKEIEQKEKKLKELADSEKEAEKRLADVKPKADDAEKKLADLNRQIADAKKALDELKKPPAAGGKEPPTLSPEEAEKRKKEAESRWKNVKDSVQKLRAKAAIKAKDTEEAFDAVRADLEYILRNAPESEGATFIKETLNVIVNQLPDTPLAKKADDLLKKK